jgi:tetratricopeptide (TPR) repeat protein
MKTDKSVSRNSENSEYEFYAFISYKRGGADEKWACRLQRELERCRIPVDDMPKDSRRVDGVSLPRRLRAFRDKLDVESHSRLGQHLSGNLDASRFLIVICSRRSAESPYVDAEVRHFVETGRGENIIPFFIEEQPNGHGFFHPPSIAAEIKGVSAEEGDEEAFIHLLSRLLRVNRENLFHAHLRASRRRMACRFTAVSVMIVLTAVLGLWALAAETRAERWRVESENLVDFLNFDVIRETTAWLPSSKLVSISERVGKYYERWEPTEPRAAFAQAVSLNRLGSVAYNQPGNRERAIDLLTSASDILENLREQEPDNESYFAECSWTLFRTGSLFEKEDRFERAEILYKKSLDTARVFSASHPDSLRGMEQIAEGLECLAKLSAARKKFDDANAFYGECGGIWGEMLRRWPEETKSWLWRMKYGDFQSGRGYVAILQNNFTDALKYEEEALAIFADFYEKDPKNLTVRLFYADELETAAFVAAKLGATDEGEFFYTAGEELWRGLVADDPQPGYVYGWARTLTTGGLIRAKQNRGKEAEALLDEAEELVDSLIRLAPGEETYLLEKSTIEAYRGYAK